MFAFMPWRSRQGSWRRTWRGSGPDAHPDHGFLRLHGADDRGWLTVAHPRGREKASPVARGLGAGKTVLGITGADESCGSDARKPCPGAGARAPRTPVRSAEPGRPRARPTGSSATANAGEPAYPPWPHSVCLPEGLAGGCAPSDPRNGNGAP